MGSSGVLGGESRQEGILGICFVCTEPANVPKEPATSRGLMVLAVMQKALEGLFYRVLFWKTSDQASLGQHHRVCIWLAPSSRL
jgi:hypothetical protein